MQYKMGDVPYLGCNAEKIYSAQPVLDTEVFNHLHTWIVDRYTIHLKKDVEHLPAPWTDNPILREFRFTNVRREHDKETKWVIQNICSLTEKDMSWMSKICNLILFRMFNKSETCKNFMPINFDAGVDWGKIWNYFTLAPDNYTFFTNAFYTSGMKGTVCKELKCVSSYADKENGVKPEFAVVRYIEEKVYKNEQLYWSLAGSKTAKDFFEALKTISALGDFLSYQIFVDYTYCPESPWSENEFVYAGFGCRKGLDMLFTNYDGMTHEEALFWLRDNWSSLCQAYGLTWEPNRLFYDLPQYDRYMNVMSLQNCFCELSKYVRAVRGTGRPRNKYKWRG